MSEQLQAPQQEAPRTHPKVAEFLARGQDLIDHWVPKVTPKNLGRVVAAGALFMSTACGASESTPRVEPTATQIIPTAAPEIKKAMTAQERAEAVKKVKDLAHILEGNIQETFYTPSNRAYYAGLAELLDEQLAQFLAEHYLKASTLHSAWRNIGIGPDNSLRLGIDNNFRANKLRVWTNLLEARNLTLSPLAQAKTPKGSISSHEARQLALDVFRLPEEITWREAKLDGSVPGTEGEYASPEGIQIEISIVHHNGDVRLKITKPSPPSH